MDTYKLLILELMLTGALFLGAAVAIAGLSFYWLHLDLEALRPAVSLL
jgi:hypothetical protein